MQKHTKVYMEAFGYDTGDFIPCEVCGNKAVDINHIDARGMGGSKEKDYIENLMAMCRPHHLQYGDRKEDKPYLRKVHQEFMDNNGVKYDRAKIGGA